MNAISQHTLITQDRGHMFSVTFWDYGREVWIQCDSGEYDAKMYSKDRAREIYANFLRQGYSKGCW